MTPNPFEENAARSLLDAVERVTGKAADDLTLDEVDRVIGAIRAQSGEEAWRQAIAHIPPEGQAQLNKVKPVRLPEDEYLCQACYRIYTKLHDDHDPARETRELHGVDVDENEMAVLCDDCWEKYKEWWETEGRVAYAQANGLVIFPSTDYGFGNFIVTDPKAIEAIVREGVET